MNASDAARSALSARAAIGLARAARRTAAAVAASAPAAVLASSALAAAVAFSALGSEQAAAHPLAGRIYDLAAGVEIGRDALVSALSAADVAILGEVHDNPWHHAAQEGLVRDIAPRALAFEMIPTAYEAALARLRAEGATPEALGAALDWSDRGWPDWAMYAPILAAAPDVPITGGAVSSEALRAAMREGAGPAAARELGAAAALYRVDAMLDEGQRDVAAAEQVAAHCGAIPEDLGRRMVEAQILRDAAFADAVLRARALGDRGGSRSGETGDAGPVALIAGSGHARRDTGAPRALTAADPGLRVLSVALVEYGAATDWREALGPEAAARFDFAWFFPGAEREDPCLGFRARRPAE